MKEQEFDELLEQARHADLADYFRTSGYTLKKISGEIYINEIKGLSIKPETNSWFSHYHQVGRVPYAKLHEMQRPVLYRKNRLIFLCTKLVLRNTTIIVREGSVTAIFLRNI